MGASDPPSMKQAIKQVLDVVYRHVQELSGILSILDMCKDLELPAPVEKGWVRIEFIDGPRTKYFIYPSLLKTTVEVADSTVPIPPYIDLRVENRLFKHALVPSIIIKGYQYVLRPIIALALSKTIMRGIGYAIKASHQDLENFVTEFLKEMEADGMIDSAKVVIEESTKYPRKLPDPDIEFIVDSMPLLSLYYRANPRLGPYMTVDLIIETELPRKDEELEPSLVDKPILVYKENTVQLRDDFFDMVTLSAPGFQISDFINTLSGVGTSKALQEVKSWIADFIQECAKATAISIIYNI